MIGFKTLACAGLVLWTTASSSFSQNNVFQIDNSDDVFLLAPRPLIRLLREGEIAFQEGRYADGITALSALLLADEGQLPDDVARPRLLCRSGL